VVAVCSKRVTLLAKLTRRRSAGGTKEAAAMLSGQAVRAWGKTTPNAGSMGGEYGPLLRTRVAT